MSQFISLVIIVAERERKVLPQIQQKERVISIKCVAAQPQEEVRVNDDYKKKNFLTISISYTKTNVSVFHQNKPTKMTSVEGTCIPNGVK